MAINYTNLLGLAKPVTGTESNTWGDVVNDQITELVEEAIASSVSLNTTSGNITLTDTQGASNQARSATLVISGSPGTSRNIVAPSRDKTYVVINGSDSSVVVKGSATTGATVSSGTRAIVTWNGSDFVTIAGSVVSLTSQVTGTLPVANGGTGGTSFSSGSLLLGNGASAVSVLSGSAVGQIPQWNGSAWTVGTLPASGVVSVTASSPLASSGGATPNISLSGTIPVASGGTGQTSYSNGQLLIGNSGGSLSPATLTAGTGITVTNGSGSITISTTGGTGTVTSVGVSGGGTGLSFSSSPITTSGTMTMSGTLSTTNGGTGVAAASLDAAGIMTKADAQTVTGIKSFNVGSSSTSAGNPTSDRGCSWGTTSTRWEAICAYSFNVTLSASVYDDLGGRLGLAGGGAARMVVDSGLVRPYTDNSTTLGTAGNRWSVVYAATGSINTSDAREKTAIEDTDLGLSFINSLRPVSYKWVVGGNDVTPSGDIRNPVVTPRPGRRKHYGLIAQEVEQSLAGKDFGGLVYDREQDQYGLRYDQFIAPLIKAVQDLSAEVEALKARISALESE